MKALILCATQRSGSTMVCGDLRGVKLLGNPEEYYIPWISSDLGKHDWKVEQEKIIEKASTANGVVSIKIMSNQILTISKKLNTILDKPKDNLYEVLHQVFKNAIWVRIIRKNTIKQAISRCMAMQTDVYHTVENGSNNFFAGKTINYNDDYNKGSKFVYKQILNSINNIKEEERLINGFFAHNQIKPIKLVYEEVAKNPESYIYEISKRIGINQNDIKIQKRKLKKLSNSLNNDWYIKTLEKYAEKLFIHGEL